jgi:hypothetical protein
MRRPGQESGDAGITVGHADASPAKLARSFRVLPARAGQPDERAIASYLDP